MINSDLDSHGLRIRWIEIRNIDDSLSVWDLRSLGTHDFGRGLSLWVLLSETSEESRLLILGVDRKSTRLNSSHSGESRMPSSA